MKAGLLDLTSPISELSTKVASELTDDELCLIGDRIAVELATAGMLRDMKIVLGFPIESLSASERSEVDDLHQREDAAFDHLRRILLGQ